MNDAELPNLVGMEFRAWPDGKDWVWVPIIKVWQYTGRYTEFFDCCIRYSNFGRTPRGYTEQTFDTRTRMHEVRYIQGKLQKWTPDSHWDDHSDYPTESWKDEVMVGDTRQGYIAWVNSQLEQAYDDGQNIANSTKTSS